MTSADFQTKCLSALARIEESIEGHERLDDERFSTINKRLGRGQHLITAVLLILVSAGVAACATFLGAN